MLGRKPEKPRGRQVSVKQNKETPSANISQVERKKSSAMLAHETGKTVPCMTIIGIQALDLPVNSVDNVK